LEELIEAGGGSVWAYGAFNAYCEDQDVYEFLTKEYVEELALHVLESSKALLSPGGGGPAGSKIRSKIVILEAGAADGRLLHFLEQEMAQLDKQLSRRCVFQATDIAPSPRAAAFGVEPIDYRRALKRYQPEIVLCSWMPMGSDWTADFRREANLEEYLLVGQSDHGNCGDNWATWGNQEFKPEGGDKSPVESAVESAVEAERGGSREGGSSKQGQSKESRKQRRERKQSARKSIASRWPHGAPYYAQDGFERKDLGTVSALQLERYDTPDLAGNSCTVSFTREGL
jgi:hypothetical protein